MKEKISWEKFRDLGFIWFVNRLLHFFGMAIMFEEDLEGNITSVYPIKTNWRGFDEKTEEKGYEKIKNYLKDFKG